MKTQIENLITELEKKYEVQVDQFARPHEEEPAVQVFVRNKPIGETDFRYDLNRADFALIGNAFTTFDLDFSIAMIEDFGIWFNVIY